jgi:anti-sigma factor RsiW
MSNHYPAEQIEMLLDGELAAGGSELQRHVDSCADCTATLARAALQKSAVRSAGKRFVARPQFRDALRERLAEKSRPSFGRRVNRLASLAAAVAFALALGWIGMTVMQWRTDRVATLSELVDIHTLTLASSNPVDVVSSDRHTVKPWFEGKVPFSFDLPDLPLDGRVALLGGKLAWIRGAAVAQMVIRDGQHRFSLFVMPSDSAAARSLRTGEQNRNGVRFLIWQRDDLLWVLAGNTDPAELEEVAKLFGR